MKRYIKLYATKPPGKSIVVEDLDNRPAIAAGDIPEAKWDVEREDGTLAKMTGQQLLDQVTGGTPGPGGSGRPAEIEIEDTTDGIRIRGKSGDATEFGPWFTVRDDGPPCRNSDRRYCRRYPGAWQVRQCYRDLANGMKFGMVATAWAEAVENALRAV